MAHARFVIKTVFVAFCLCCQAMAADISVDSAFEQVRLDSVVMDGYNFSQDMRVDAAERIISVVALAKQNASSVTPEYYPKVEKRNWKHRQATQEEIDGGVLEFLANKLFHASNRVSKSFLLGIFRELSKRVQVASSGMAYHYRTTARIILKGSGLFSDFTVLSQARDIKKSNFPNKLNVLQSMTGIYSAKSESDHQNILQIEKYAKQILGDDEMSMEAVDQFLQTSELLQSFYDSTFYHPIRVEYWRALAVGEYFSYRSIARGVLGPIDLKFNDIIPFSLNSDILELFYNKVKGYFSVNPTVELEVTGDSAIDGVVSKIKHDMFRTIRSLFIKSKNIDKVTNMLKKASLSYAKYLIITNVGKEVNKPIDLSNLSNLTSLVITSKKISRGFSLTNVPKSLTTATFTITEKVTKSEVDWFVKHLETLLKNTKVSKVTIECEKGFGDKGFGDIAKYIKNKKFKIASQAGTLNINQASSSNSVVIFDNLSIMDRILNS